MGNARVRCRQ